MFTQIIQLSDGSMYTHRTTSPTALYKSQKDKMNHLLWQPNNKALQNVEVDEAGKLAAFRERFGRQWDLATPKVDVADEDGDSEAAKEAEEKAKKQDDDAFSMTDLLKGYADASGQDYSAVKGRRRKKPQG